MSCMNSLELNLKQLNAMITKFLSYPLPIIPLVPDVLFLQPFSIVSFAHIN